MKNFSTFIGMDVHMETIAVATARKHGAPRYYGEIANTSEALTKLAPMGVSVASNSTISCSRPAGSAPLPGSGWRPGSAPIV